MPFSVQVDLFTLHLSKTNIRRSDDVMQTELVGPGVRDGEPMLEVGKNERTQACRRNRCRCLKITLVVIVILFLMFVICLFVGSEFEMKAVRKADDTGKITFPRCGFFPMVS